MVTLKADESWRRGTKGHQKRWWMMKNPTIWGNPSKKGSTGPLLGQMDGWLGVCNTDSVTLMEINWILKMIVFGSSLFTNDFGNLKHQGSCQKLMIGWHKHHGVSETPKNADVICEQPLTDSPWWLSWSPEKRTCDKIRLCLLNNCLRFQHREGTSWHLLRVLWILMYINYKIGELYPGFLCLMFGIQINFLSPSPCIIFLVSAV